MAAFGAHDPQLSGRDWRLADSEFSRTTVVFSLAEWFKLERR